MSAPVSPWHDDLNDEQRDMERRRHLYFELGDHRALNPDEVAAYLIELSQNLDGADRILADPANGLTADELSRLTALADGWRVKLARKDLG